LTATNNLPHNIELERSVLGTIIRDNGKFPGVLKILGDSPDVFYDWQNKAVWRAMLALDEEGMAIDEMTLYSRIRDDIDEAPGLIADLSSSPPTSWHALYYAREVYRYYMSRRIIELSRMATEAAEQHSSIDTHLEIQSRLSEALRESGGDSECSLHDVLPSTVAHLRAIYEGTEAMLSTGIPAIDNYLGGFEAGTYALLAARPSVGKTALAVAITHHVAVKNKIPLLFISLEMHRERIAERLMCVHCGVSPQLLRLRRTADFLKAESMEKLEATAHEIDAVPVYFQAGSTLSMAQIASCIRDHVCRHGIRLVICDYMQLIHRTRGQNTNTEVSEISWGWRRITNETGIPALVLSQLNRGGEGERPRASNLRDSGSLEQDADVVLLMWRQDESSQTPEYSPVTLRVEKNRNGETGESRMMFDKVSQRFFPLDDRQQPPPKNVYANAAPPREEDDDDDTPF